LDTQNLEPPVNLLEDFQAMHQTIVDDQSGDKTRRLVSYFREAEQHATELGLRTQNFEQKQFAGLLNDALAASSRIVLGVWQKAHGAELAV
jgi:redox-regulated HSP33 family molecular chaperone